MKVDANVDVDIEAGVSPRARAAWASRFRCAWPRTRRVQSSRDSFIAEEEKRENRRNGKKIVLRALVVGAAGHDGDHGKPRARKMRLEELGSVLVWIALAKVVREALRTALINRFTWKALMAPRDDSSFRFLSAGIHETLGRRRRRRVSLQIGVRVCLVCVQAELMIMLLQRGASVTAERARSGGGKRAQRCTMTGESALQGTVAFHAGEALTVVSGDVGDRSPVVLSP